MHRVDLDRQPLPSSSPYDFIPDPLISQNHHQGEETLEKNKENLITECYELEFEVDPLFGKNSIKFDEMGVRGLLINNIQIDQNL